MKPSYLCWYVHGYSTSRQTRRIWWQPRKVIADSVDGINARHRQPIDKGVNYWGGHKEAKYIDWNRNRPRLVGIVGNIRSVQHIVGDPDPNKVDYRKRKTKYVTHKAAFFGRGIVGNQLTLFGWSHDL
jgi:hypothetical protein